MKSLTLSPMLAMLGLSWVEIFLMLASLLVLLLAIGFIVGLGFWLARRKLPSSTTPPVQSNAPTRRFCHQCGNEMAADAPQGLCPACLMKVALGSEGGNPAVAGERKPAPPPADIAKHFPQLEILELLGQGGMGMVYKARQRQLDRLVALKILPSDSGRDPAFAERFSREARALARLNHPNIVSVYDFGHTCSRRGNEADEPASAGNPPPHVGGYVAGEDFYYFIMEFVDGVNLRQMEHTRRLTPKEALTIVPRICDALQYAHDEGIVHRDIKPENILIDKKGRVKIADFGLAKLLGQAPKDFRLTGSAHVMGTPHYMAPEQLEHPLDVDHRADIYSLGVVFYEMLTGELPLGRFAPPSAKAQLDVRLDEVVLRSLEKEPERRYQHISQVKTDVENISGLVEKLPAHLRQAFGYEYRSSRTLFGLPLVHVSHGVDFATGKSKTARGIIAIGGKAEGVFAFGGVAKGVFAFGGMAIGVVAVGGLAIGFVGLGGLAIGLLLAFGGGAIGTIAVGGGAIGFFATGGGAWGVHALGGNAHDPLAKQFFDSWSRLWMTYLAWGLCLIPALVAGGTQIILRHRAGGDKAGPKKNRSRRLMFGAGCAILGGLVVLGVALNVTGKRSFETARGLLQTKLAEELTTRLANEKRITYSRITFEFDPHAPRATVSFGGLQGWRGVTNHVPRALKGQFLLHFNSPDMCEATGTGDLAGNHYLIPVGNRGMVWWDESAPPAPNHASAATEVWSPAEKPDPAKVLEEAHAFATQKGHYDDALQRLIWYHNHAQEFSTNNPSGWLISALSDWVELGRRYPKARQALIEIRDRKNREFAEGRGYFELFQETANINQYLPDDAATVALFQRIEQWDAVLAGQCYLIAESLLVKRGEYGLCLRRIGDYQARFNGIRHELDFQNKMAQDMADTYKRLGRTNTPPVPSYALDQRKRAEDRFVGQTRTLIEILVGAGRKADAEKIREQAVAVLDDERLKSAVSDAEKRVAANVSVTR